VEGARWLQITTFEIVRMEWHQTIKITNMIKYLGYPSPSVEVFALMKSMKSDLMLYDRRKNMTRADYIKSLLPSLFYF
jgi:hypothetical protein